MALALERLPVVDPVWTTLRSEADAIAAGEPGLASFVHASVLAHGRLEEALAFHLATKLGNADMGAMKIRDTFQAAFAAAPAPKPVPVVPTAPAPAPAPAPAYAPQPAAAPIPGPQAPAYDPAANVPQLLGHSLRAFLITYQSNAVGDFWPLFGGRKTVGRSNSGDTAAIDVGAIP